MIPGPAFSAMAGDPDPGWAVEDIISGGGNE